jgi:(R,R)-butanediol dehydrogenase/meso-butanediol dehydrogenase/diacetyl reductase
MRAAVFQGAGRKLAVERLPDPAPAPDQVVLKLGACGICVTDLSITSGRGTVQVPPGFVPGHEYAGEVVAVGAQVERLRIGDRVAVLPCPNCGACANCLEGEPWWCTNETPPHAGGFAEYAAVNERDTVLLPDALTLADGALVEPLAVGLHGVHLADLDPGDRVLVLGAGPIGLATTFWARRLGAGPLAVMATSRRRERFATAFGASTFLVAGDDPAGEAAEALGGPPSVVIEAAGVRGALARALDVVADRGTVLSLGFLTVEDSFVPALAMRKQTRLQFAWCYGMRDYRHVVDTLAMDPTQPRTMITETVSLDGLVDVFETLRGPNEQCKVMVEPNA